ncbi:GNAT family N-acetyltransferase [Corticicoccus populi]|uniref:GNAT family N-acetyltransferase n=1 Tax=Corticicoccus populi TaxID=1812821 RepID=A0ABW5WY87_9STAP
MTLRQAGISDLKKVLEITEKVVPIMRAAGNTQWSERYPNEERFLEDINNGTLFVYEEQEIKGFVVIDNNHAEAYEEIEWTLPGNDTMAMHRMAVDPDSQGQGIASKIFQSADNIIKTAGYSGIHTDTSLENKVMQNIFRKNGFHFKGKLHLDDNQDDWYVAYEKLLYDTGR